MVHERNVFQKMRVFLTGGFTHLYSLYAFRGGGGMHMHKLVRNFSSSMHGNAVPFAFLQKLPVT